MAKYTTNRIYTYVVEKIKTVYPTIYHASRYEAVPASFPCVFIMEIRNTENERYASLDRTDDQWSSTFEVQVQSDKKIGGKEEAEQIMEEVKRAFKNLFFFRIMCEPVGTANTTTYRIVARFKRTIGGGEEMPL